MAKDDDASIFDELDSRLDDFFAEDDDLLTDEDISEGKNEEIFEDSADAEINSSDESVPMHADEKVDPEAPLNRLKAIVLEMDWEISDDNLNRYLLEINQLIANYKDDRPIYLFFKLHAAIGQYMLTKKAQAHPDALKFLYSVYNSLEQAFTPDIPVLEKNRLILNEVNNFKDLKNKLFPNFSYAQLHNTEYDTIEDEVESSSVSQPDIDNQHEPDFDINALPDDIQKGINDYIEKTIAEKLESIKKELQGN